VLEVNEIMTVRFSHGVEQVAEKSPELDQLFSKAIKDQRHKQMSRDLTKLKESMAMERVVRAFMSRTHMRCFRTQIWKASWLRGRLVLSKDPRRMILYLFAHV